MAEEQLIETSRVGNVETFNWGPPQLANLPPIKY
jgi:hypothetical protein